MGYYFKAGWSLDGTTEPPPHKPNTLHEWIANEYPDMTKQEINYHILNLSITLGMSTEQLEQWLLEGHTPDKLPDADSDAWWFLDEPPY